MSDQIFHRPWLASTFAARILSERSASGIFLAAPRRTGKSTFIREDLAPELIKAGAEVIYVDLWADRAADPGEMISAAIRNHLILNESRLMQWVRKGGLDKVSVAGFQVDVDKIGIGTGETIARGLSMMSDATNAIIVLVIDEAQHGITTDKGADALFALKAARDELNSSQHHGFRLIATGSNRDKLAMLVSGKDQAFFGAPLIDLPYLDDEFLAWDRVRFDGNAMPSMDAMRESFSLCGYRPEYLMQSLITLTYQFDLTETNVDERLIAETRRKINDAKNDFLRLVNSLPPIQAAVLKVIASDGVNYSPFKTTTVDRYKSFCNEFSSENVRIDYSSIQYALEALREKTLIWKSSRGVYAIEDSQHAAWLTEIESPMA